MLRFIPKFFTIRFVTFGFALFFTGVVAIGWVPSLIEWRGNDRLLLGLFELSVLDDCTHGITAIAALLASLRSRQLSLLFLTAFGYYYALDATFFLTYGFFNEKTWIQDILLNAPHVAISTTMLTLVHWYAKHRD